MNPKPPTNLTISFDGFDKIKYKKDYQSNLDLAVTEAECIHAAVAIGAPYFGAAAPLGTHAANLALYKAMSLTLALSIKPDGINRLPEYDALDSTEKRNISYWLGMTFASLAARHAFGIDKLFHAESMYNDDKLKKTNPKSKRLADIIGIDNKKRWHVIEAKSTQVAPSQKMKDKWREQAKNTISTVEGAAPHTMSCSSLVLDSRLRVTLIDPSPSIRATGIRLTQGLKTLDEWYYRPWLSTADSAKNTIQLGQYSGKVVAAVIDPVGGRTVQTGLVSEMVTILSKVGSLTRLEQVRGESYYVGPDGIFVQII